MGALGSVACDLFAGHPSAGKHAGAPLGRKRAFFKSLVSSRGIDGTGRIPAVRF